MPINAKDAVSSSLKTEYESTIFCIRLFEPQHYVGLFPTPVGMNRNYVEVLPEVKAFPHASGDEPQVAHIVW